MLFKKALFASLCLLLVPSVFAGPMGFSESYMSMGDFNPNWRELFVNYAITPRDAVGLSATYMRNHDASKSRTLEELTYTRLLKRWNMPEAQANAWFVGGIGALQARDDDHSNRDKVMVTPGVQLDYETTRVYFAANYRFYRATGINHDFASLRAGFSFYETGFDDTQPWLILEARNMNGLSDKIEVTPMLRLINKRFFVEAGVNNARQPRFNFMLIF